MILPSCLFGSLAIAFGHYSFSRVFTFQIQDFLKFIFVYFRAEYQKCRNRVDILRTDKIFKKNKSISRKKKNL